MKPGEVAEQLVERLLLPLMQGGRVQLVPPVGEALAVQLAQSLPGAELFEDVQRLKLQRARALYPVDFDVDLSADEWLLLAALNDLLQLTNPTLLGPFGGVGNRQKLAILVRSLIERVGAPQTVWQALSRHALFGRVPRLVRRDTVVSWWTGSRTFSGAKPPARLLAWPALRQVRQVTRDVPIMEMEARDASQYLELFHRFIATTPLTSFASVGVMPFVWMGSNLAFSTTESGRQLAVRCLLCVDDVPAALNEISQAARDLEQADPAAFAHARQFADVAAARFRQFGRPATVSQERHEPSMDQ